MCVQCFIYKLLTGNGNHVVFIKFKMENIQQFVSFCENYGVPKTCLFQTVDLYENRNMAQVLSCVQGLGSEVSFGLTACLTFLRNFS